MCGIVGLVSKTPISELDLSLLNAMRDTLCHRGPDDFGEWLSKDRKVGLAHRRLSIIDLSPGGHQPMLDSSGEICIIFNGEIYNYQELRRELEIHGCQFRTASDTEVILEAYRLWGVECLSHLNGMFAFALYDESSRRLFMARDRAGEKPFFYWHTSDRLIFVSELKALMADPSFPRLIDVNALDYYFTYGYVPGNMCIFKGVRKLSQGHAATYDLVTNTLNVWCYWQLPVPNPKTDVSIGVLKEELEALLEDSVRRQLIADVPVGILLSGGLDSSLVTAMAARVSSRPVKTFTVSFPGHAAYDEGPHARQVAQYFGTEHTELVAEPATVEILPMLARQYDEPMADSSMVPTYLISQLISQHAKVALGGDGGDELFGGYKHYSWIQWIERVRHFVFHSIRRAGGQIAAKYLPIGFRGRNHIIGFSSNLAHSIAHVNMYFDYVTRRHLLSNIGLNLNQNDNLPESYRASLCLPTFTPLQQATRTDFRTTLVDGYLVKVDRASMLSSLEVRSPLLDHRIIEFAFGVLPDKLRATKKKRKILLRQLAVKLLPNNLNLNRKQGLTMPLNIWFKKKWGRFIEDVLMEADKDLFNPNVINNILNNQHRGYDNTNRLFALTIFELWRREYKARF